MPEDSNLPKQTNKDDLDTLVALKYLIKIVPHRNGKDNHVIHEDTSTNFRLKSMLNF